MRKQSQHTDNACKIGEWTVQPDRLRLVLGDRSVALQPRSMDTLMCLAKRRGEVVSADELISAVWGRTIVEDSAVYQTIAKLRKALDDDPHHPKYIETIPKKGYRLIAAVETTSKSVAPQTAGGAERWHWTRHATVLVAALVAGAALLFATSRIGEDRASAPSPGARPVSIAVLPFSDMSEDGSQAYLGDGIAEELIHTLTQLPGIRVLARTSSFSLRDQPLDVPAIADRLDADAILEGSIRRQGETLWVTAQLVDGANGLHYWSEKYERPARDVLSVQTDIARRVAETVSESRDAIASIDDTHVPPAEAYELYLLGRHQTELRRRDSLSAAIGYLERAIEIDGDFAKAHAALARTLFLASDRRYGTVPEDEAIERAQAAADRSVELDQTLTEGWIESARLALYGGDPDTAETFMQRALQLDGDNPHALAMLGDLRIGQDRLEDAREAFLGAIRVDPLSARRHLALMQISRDLRLYDEAETHLRLTVEIDPAWPTAWYVGAGFFMDFGRIAESVRWASRGATVGSPDERYVPAATYVTGYGWFMLENTDQARRWIDRSVAISPDGELFYMAEGRIHLLLAEDRDQEAHDLLERFTAPDKTDAGLFAMGGLYEMMLGHDDHALAMYERARHMPADPGGDAERGSLFRSRAVAFGYFPALNLAALYGRLGRDKEADALLDESKAYIANQLELGGQTYLRASVATLEGDRDEAIRLLGLAVDRGWVRRWYFERDPNMASIVDEPESRRIVDEMSERIRAMRKALEQDPGDSILPEKRISGAQR